ncbi:MAG: HAD-IIB family hydrolase, partial [Luteolibacter sp.]
MKTQLTTPSSHHAAPSQKPGLYIVLVSLHGLLRADEWELGRDADTGGQIRYVLELARALGEHPEVDRVDLITRQIIDPRVGESYAKTSEPISDKVTLHRIAFGPKRYLNKEKLWPYLDMFVDRMIAFFRRQGRIPDILHAHYADAGQAAAQLARLLGIPFIFTGHSLGRVKRERLLAQGKKAADIEERYALRTRIEAEEYALETASMVVASTFQEIEDQYQHYDHYVPERMEVIPPGVDLSSFSADHPSEHLAAVRERIERFFTNPSKPVILSMARPDERKNLEQLIHVYGQSPELRQRANLALILGHRDDIREMAPAQRRIMQRLFVLIDTYDLYGSIAYPKTQHPQEVPAYYQYAAARRGIFVNIALTEPFGLTLLEAGASGLPVVATHDGGPRDILANCRNGLLVDPLDREGIEKSLLSALDDPERYQAWVRCGISGTREHYSWRTHVNHYLRELMEIDRLAEHNECPFGRKKYQRGMPHFDRLLITDIDNTLTGDEAGMAALMHALHEHADRVGFGIATGRSLDDLKQLLEQLDLPAPDVIISSAGTEIHYRRELVPDRSWKKHILYQWQPDRVRAELAKLPGLFLQDKRNQSPTKISYNLDPERAPTLPEIRRALRSAGLRTKVILSHGIFLDVIPTRAGPGLSIRHLGIKWGFPPEHLLVAGDSGNDEEMLRGGTLGIVVGNHSPELRHLRNRPRIHFTRQSHAWGVLEGIEYYDFFG